MAKTILDMLEGAASRFGEAPYVARKGDEGWMARSFGQVNQDAQALAARHIELGLPRNQPVAILSEGSPNWVIGEFRILKAGGFPFRSPFSCSPRKSPSASSTRKPGGCWCPTTSWKNRSRLLRGTWGA